MCSRLTSTRGAGCGCKLGKAALAEALRAMPTVVDPNVLVGFDGADDAAVYRLGDDLAVCATVDFFTPVVEDAATFGAIAATNAMSDLFAMGAKPLFALAVTAFPRDGDAEVLAAIIRGGAQRALAEGCPVLGGHTIDDPEPKYGLAVIGAAHPDRLLTNDAGRPGDRLLLTKPLGVGIVAHAARAGAVSAALLARATEQMLTANRAAADAACASGVRCVTDVTGFGLIGHAQEVAAASGVCVEISASCVPMLDGVVQLAKAGFVPGGTGRNRDYAAPLTDFDGVGDAVGAVLFDPQTSGGLLLAVAPERTGVLHAELASRGVNAWEIGRLTAGPAGRVRVAR